MKRKNASLGEISFNTVNYAIFILFMIICIYPFYYVLIYSFSDAQRASAQGVFLFPAGFSLVTYKGIFKANDIFQAFSISLFRTVLGVVITILACSFLAFLLTKKQMYFRRFVYRMLVSTMYLNAGLIPWYLVMKAYGLKDNFLLYIIPSAISAFYVILIKTYIEQISTELEESAMIDGAGYLTTFIKIVFPVSLPIIACIAVYAAVGQWNSWTDNFFLVNDDKLQTLQMVLYTYLNQANKFRDMTVSQLQSANVVKQITPQSVKTCITVIVTLPIIFAYPFLQRYFIKGIMIGAIKG